MINVKEYKYRTELHAHSTPGSSCSNIPPEELVRVYSELGYDSVVLTNHFYPGMRFYGDKEKAVYTYLLDYKTACEYGKKYGINVILGCEIRFSDNCNDYLIFGINEEFLLEAYDYLDGDLETFSKWFRGDGHLLLQAHPFRKGMTLADPNLLDGVETFNMHPGHNSAVGFACKYAKEHDFIVSAGTDYHHVGHEGLAGILTKNIITNSFELEEVLRSRDYLLEVAGNVILPYVK